MRLKEKTLFSPDAILAHVQSGVTAAMSSSLEHGWHDARDDSFVIEQRDRLSKKFVSSLTDTDMLSLTAYLQFEEIQSVMKSVNSYPFPNPGVPLGLDLTSRRLLKARAIIARVLGDFSEDEFFDYCRHSSGSSIGVPYWDTSPEAKFRGLTASAGVERWFDYYLKYDGSLSSLLGEYQVKIVPGSMATTVPKDNTKVRMICVEPTLNMFFQQGLMQMLSSRLDKVGLSFDVQQDVNRKMAFLSSLSGEYATIDWSSASDTIAYGLVSFLFPRKWFYYLDAFRAKSLCVLGSYDKLESFSTMGNATTFPVETLVFWAMAQAVLDTTKSTLGPEEFSPHVFVFGDDCILPTRFASEYIDFMSRFGFCPNLGKTFITGRFRESCGGDFLAGRDVRPYYLTGPSGETLNHLQAWLYVIFNRLLNRCIRIWGPLKYMYCAKPIFDTLFSLFRKYRLTIHIVPTYFPDDSGLKIGCDLARFLTHYHFRRLLSPITVDRHGTFRFSFLRSYYPDRRHTSENIRYWLALKGLAVYKPSHTFVRKRQMYQVAKGTSCCFVLNKDGKH